MSSLSEEDKFEIGQHFVFGFHGLEPSEDVITLIREYKIGNIILMKRNIQNFNQVRKLVHSLQTIAKEAGHRHPLLIGIDQENGHVSPFSNPNGEAGTQFPGATTVTSIWEYGVAERIARATANELKMAGINWVFSPVADVNSNSNNSVIGARSYGKDPNRVAGAASMVARGLSQAGRGVAACAKHFPGQGDTQIGSHLALPVVNKTYDDLGKTELVPFRRLDVDSIMIGHISLPALRVFPSDETDICPASLSKVAITHLLRYRLSFNGVVVTDCLEKKAISDTAYGPGIERGAVLALQAGADIAMACHTFDSQVGSIKAVYASVGAGELSMADMRVSGERVAWMKTKYAREWEINANKFEWVTEKEWKELKQENRLLSLRMYAAAMTWALPDNPHPIPRELIDDTRRSDIRSKFKPLDHWSIATIYTPAKEIIDLAIDDPSSDALDMNDGVQDVGILRKEGGVERNMAGESYIAFGNAIARRAGRFNVAGQFVYSASNYASTRLLFEKVVIVCLRNAHQPSGAWQIKFLKRVLLYAPKSTRILVVVTYGQYDLSGQDADTRFVVEMLKERGEPVLYAFEFTKEALEAAADALYGCKDWL
ncbi:glycoside hydrolase [Schizopora paradoxa]|uniref:Glycoside hydrolase n=1 Tax=Schizopora paradoxa TaxID=27342 RepID=A0A0H2R331_9AGAM|nr:glycoside hydrolase [Schizopora paradoxa]